MKFHKILFAILILFAFSTNEGFAQKKGKKGKKKKAQAETVDIIQVEGKLIEAKKEISLGNDKKAEKLFLDILELDPNVGLANYELSRIASRRETFDDALKYIEKAIEQEGDKNKWYNLHYANLQAQTGNYKGAAETYGKLIKNHPNNPDYYLDQAQLQTITGQYKEAIKTLDNLEKRIGIDEMVVFEKQRLYVQLNDVDGAASELEKLIDNFPAEARYYHALAELYEANGEKDKALKVYERLLAKDPDDPYARLAKADQYNSQGDKDKGFEELKTVFSNKNLAADPKLRLMFSRLGNEKLNDANALSETIELAKILANTHEDNADVQGIYGELLIRNNQKEEGIEAFKKAVAIDGSRIEIWQQLLAGLADAGNFKEMAEESQNGIEVFPNQVFMYYFNGIANSRVKDYERAEKSLKRAALIGSDDKLLMSDIYSQLGETYNAMKKYEKSDDAFNNALEENPENSLVLNNYSYYLSLRDDKLDKAAEMAKLANTLEPDNPSFLDTYGWILYRQQKFEEAKEWLKKALDNGGDKRAVILDHYGDVLYRLNEIDNAVEYWEKAQELGLKSDVLQRKIADRKVYE